MENKKSADVFEAIVLLTSRSECEAFFEDLCSFSEIENIAIRYAVAIMLIEGKTYREINARLNVANATISRVKSVVENDNSSLKKIIQRQIDEK